MTQLLNSAGKTVDPADIVPPEPGVVTTYVEYRGRKEDGTPDGYLHILRYKTPREIFNEIRPYIDLRICRKCGFETHRTPNDHCAPCEKCGEETELLIDEGINVHYLDEDKPIEKYFRLFAYAVTGGNEGHYWHVAVLRHADNCEMRVQYLFGGKTFAGMERAQDLVRRVTKIMQI